MPLFGVIHHIIGPGRQHQGQVVAILELDPAVGRRQRPAVVEHDQPGGVLQAVGQRAGDLDLMALRYRGGLVSIRQLERAGVATGLVGGEPDHENFIRVTAKVLPPEGGAAGRIRRARDGVGQVEFPPVTRRRCVPWQFEAQIAQHLVGAHGIVTTGGVLIAGPKAALVEHEALDRRVAQDQRAHAAVANGQRLVHAFVGRGRFLVPQGQVPGGGGAHAQPTQHPGAQQPAVRNWEAEDHGPAM